MCDILHQAAVFYAENLANRKFKLVAGKKGTKIELTIVFGSEHFKHLAGLHKLTDLPICKRDSANVYKEILDKKTNISDLQKSRFFCEVEKRLNDFCKIKTTLLSPNLMLKSLNGYFLGITADYLLSQNENHTDYAHLFLKVKNDIVVPVTFFIRDDDKYLKQCSVDSAFYGRNKIVIVFFIIVH